ncbi:HAD family hydrolase [Rhodococcus rhodnii]|uniref:HAD family hydrolase n=1 Tax=Rhodococcus rhodnii TaxID=38312 RepID=A0A6P2CGG5_9NOCA|nr:HAD family hydrolase [Rhodococcus rhodnii]
MLFDLDGTITDSAPGIHRTFRHALAAVDRPVPGDDVLATIIGPPMRDTFVRLGFDPPTAERAITAYTERYDEQGWAENSVYPGMRDVLRTARELGLRTAVATSKAEPFAARILEHFDLTQYLDFVGGATLDGSRRAKSDVIAHSLRALGVNPGEHDGVPIVMVGDREHDVEGAALWGVKAVFVAWGYGAPAEAEHAWRTVATTGELEEVLRELAR